jgi:hypothetical protein
MYTYCCPSAWTDVGRTKLLTSQVLGQHLLPPSLFHPLLTLHIFTYNSYLHSPPLALWTPRSLGAPCSSSFVRVPAPTFVRVPAPIVRVPVPAPIFVRVPAPAVPDRPVRCVFLLCSRISKQSSQSLPYPDPTSLGALPISQPFTNTLL